MNKTTRDDLAALHAADAAMRDAWQAFDTAARGRRHAAAAIGADAGEIDLGNMWSETTLMVEIGTRIADLPSGVRLDLAAGRGIVRRQEIDEQEAERLALRALAKARVAESSARIAAQMNAALGENSPERARALKAIADLEGDR